MKAQGQISLPDSASELRTSARRRVLLSGKIIFGDVDLSVDCAIRDLTRLGAKVRLKSALALPSDVYLIELRSGVIFESRITWRRLPELGLKFLGSQKLGETTDPRMKRLKRIWKAHAAR